ncbi:hypothetical protein BX659_106163 [Orenia metallireducens]|uniref:Uncharacterized protein n=1 Tax=Orenia metallireducens TaxID=1413210 RepID=A0A285GY28_9FIRM|nr:hypothetical protein BX659_106163 [Orenia metallireducens]SNY27436.1 hypothetical protein SAMN06265827_11123 [Orenia metallireducens]
MKNKHLFLLFRGGQYGADSYIFNNGDFNFL